MVVIRPVSPLDDLSALGAIHGPDSDTPRRRRTLVVAADSDQIAQALLHELERAADRPLMFNVESHAQVIATIARDGYCSMVDSTTVRFAAADALRVLHARCEGVPAGYVVFPSESISDGVTAYYERVYETHHRWAGRYTPPSAAPWTSLVGPPVDADRVVQVATRSGQIVSVTSLHTGLFAEDADAFLAPASVLVDTNLDERVAVLGVLLRETLHAALAAGISVVNADYDTPNYDDLAVLIESLPTTQVSSRQVWIRER